MDWRVMIDYTDEDREIAEAFAQGVATIVGQKVTLLRVDHGDEIHVGDFSPKQRGHA